MKADRISLTSDGSLLIDLFDGDGPNGCFEIYPNGDIVVIIHRDGKDEIYEYEISEIAEAFKTFQQAQPKQPCA